MASQEDYSWQMPTCGSYVPVDFSCQGTGGRFCFLKKVANMGVLHFDFALLAKWEPDSEDSCSAIFFK